MLDVNKIIQGDCLEVMRGLPENSIDSFVSDAPAGVSFMNKTWDSDKGGRKQWCAYMEERFAEALRVCKPGAYGLVWALPRTSHWTATALEDSGWELRDVITHHFGSGFPKSQDIGKMIDKMKGADREVVGKYDRRSVHDGAARTSEGDTGSSHCSGRASIVSITAPATPEAKQWDGWGTNLKPASEHWILVRKPIAETIAGNVLEWGVGALNIDGCRVETNGDSQGRFPANLVLSHAHDCTDDGCADGCPVQELDDQTGYQKTGTAHEPDKREMKRRILGKTKTLGRVISAKEEGGGGSRYFPKFHYFPKASTSDRSHKGQVQNNHPTVKNRELMRWLCRLVTPPGGTVLDCFAGSGSTAIACLEEGFNYILIEQNAESVQTANDRVNVWLKENKPQSTIEERLTWLETKVDAIDARTRKIKKIVEGQLGLFDEAG